MCDPLHRRDSPIRVLVADDSVVVRRLLSDALNQAPDIEVVGTAPDGRIALQKLTQLQPDAVTLDIEMPTMDGLETLIELRKTHPRLPVIMCSTLTSRGASATLDALALGASDYVTKPTARAGDLDALRDDLVAKVRALCGRASPDAPPRRSRAPIAPRATPSGRTEAVVIGVSTGGPTALSELVPALPGALSVPVLVVQHMPPMFTRMLAERLDARSALRVVEASDGEVVVPGTVYVSPGGRHLTVERRGADDPVRIRLDDGPAENSCRPSVDVLFRSAARIWGGNVLAAVLTGMGQDGFRGSEQVVSAGGAVIAQDEATSVVWGMPGIVVRHGLADAVVPLDEMAQVIARRALTRMPALPRAAGGGGHEPRCR